MATRRERVELDLVDRFTPGIVKAAAGTALLNKELHSLSRDSVQTRRSVSDIDRDTDRLGRSVGSTSREVDKLSGRMRIFADLAAILGPSLIPIGAIGVPAVAGLAAQFGFAAVAGGTAILAFQGVGDALKALNDYQLSPTEAHLQALQDKMGALGPAGRQFVRELQELRPELQRLQTVAQAGMFPGVVEGLQAMERALPEVEAVIAAVSKEMGDIAAATGESLASDRWLPFLEFIGREAPTALADMAKAAGNTAHAVAELIMASDPLNDDFSQWLVRATASLDRWATGLSKTQGFQDFVDYIRTTGPQVGETLGAIANALIQIVQAAAPLGGPVLAGVEALAKMIAAIADSDLGTPIFTFAAGLALLNRTMAITGAIQGRTFGGPAVAQIKGYGASIRGLSADWAAYTAIQNTAAGRARASVAAMDAQAAAGKRLGANLRTVGKGAALMGGLAIASTGAADKIGLTNTTSLALMGTLGGPWGVALGAATGALIDARAASSGFADALKNVDQVIASNNLDEMIAKLDQLKAARADAGNVTGVGDFFGDLATRIRSNPLPLPHFLEGDSGDPVAKLESNIKKVEDAMAGATQGANTSAEATDAYGNTIAGTGRNAQTTAAQIRGMVDAMKAQRQEALAAFSAETQYRQALKDAQAQAKKSNAGIKGSSDEALKNREAIESLAAAWNNQSDAVKNNEAKFKAAKSAFIDTAVAMGVPEDAARRLARRLLEIPQKRVVGVTLDAQDALGAIARIKDQLAHIPREVRTRYYVTQMNAFNKPRGTPGNPDGTGADGATVPKDGRPYADRYLYMLAPGEEIITNRHGEADRFRADRAAGRIPAYADGGTIRAPFGAAGAGTAIDYDRLAAAVSGDRLLAYRTTRGALTDALRTVLSEMPVQRVDRDLSLIGAGG